MWALFEKVLVAKDMSKFMLEGYETKLAPILQQDYDDFYADQAFLDEFPLPQFTGTFLSLKYCSWEEYKKGRDPADIPLEQPVTWNPIDDQVNKKDLLRVYRDIPQSEYALFNFYLLYMYHLLMFIKIAGAATNATKALTQSEQ